jgi:hypothetical protein
MINVGLSRCLDCKSGSFERASCRSWLYCGDLTNHEAHLSEVKARGVSDESAVGKKDTWMFELSLLQLMLGYDILLPEALYICHAGALYEHLCSTVALCTIFSLKENLVLPPRANGSRP